MPHRGTYYISDLGILPDMASCAQPLLILAFFLLLGESSCGTLVLRKDGRTGHSSRQFRGNPEPPFNPVSCNNVLLVDFTAPISVVDPQFLSVTLDAGDIRSNWSSINFTAPRIVNMAKALSPAMLRVGGTSADFLIFSEANNSRCHC